jgi:hypothetical protein
MLAITLLEHEWIVRLMTGTGRIVRLRITQRLHGSIDGMQLDRFQLGLVYDVGPVLGSLLLAEQWAEPVDDDYESTVTPVTNVRQFAESGHGAKPPYHWRRRPARREVATAADHPPRRSKKRHP